MSNTCRDKGGKRPFSNKAVLGAVSNIDESRGRLNLAGLGLAAPLLSARVGHAAREAARAEADPHATPEERADRAAAYQRVAGDLTLLHKETARAQVTPIAPADARSAVLYGRVHDGGKPIARARVVAEAPGVRLAHACADGEGRYALEVPGDADVTFAVARATGPIVRRDTCPTRLSPGQRLYRDFDLNSGEPPCEPPEADQPPPRGTRPEATKDEPTKDTSTPPKEDPPKDTATPPKAAEPPKDTATPPKKDEPPPKTTRPPTGSVARTAARTKKS